MKRISSLILLTLILSSPPALMAGERKTKLDFEDQLVEGVNKRPLDSLSSVNDGSGAGRNRHLYRRKTRFESENRRTLQDLAEYSTQR